MLKGGEQIIPAAPKSRFNTLGLSGRDQQDILLGYK
jgi:hypothetical protein